MSFAEAVDVRALGEGRFSWDVPDGWQQGRGAWGGLVVGGLTGAVLDHESDPSRTLRTVSVHLSAPLLPGPAQVRVTPLRVGSGMSTWAAGAEQPSDAAPDGELVAHAVVVTGRARAADLAASAGSWGTAVPPDLPPWQELRPASTSGPGWPTFMQHLEFRVCSGTPFGAGPARCSGYVAFRDARPWDALRLVAVVDAWYPTAFARLAGPRPMATVTYAAHLLVDPASVADGPLAFESSLSAASDGYTSETRRLWTLDGRLAVENHQSLVVVR